MKPPDLDRIEGLLSTFGENVHPAWLHWPRVHEDFAATVSHARQLERDKRDLIELVETVNKRANRLQLELDRARAAMKTTKEDT